MPGDTINIGHSVQPLMRAHENRYREAQATILKLEAKIRDLEQELRGYKLAEYRSTAPEWQD